ncbi:MAG: hypothetical protein LHW64_01695 [Candidatus Cloacimonetes bacterium]|nr:hypothetical protein [Candidatus Cloacimonadota bacterium]MCB5286499.1 hypothetical protein [Candidatus Cloacimonadota bacterium]MCK9184319.1 hypothetical protein [Candidatus Cloacimonadota bacterium]MCK9584260.1 hypothetical protein [Candidatus Cloacimonadota bacterium]MDY0228821.1 hypothetical protein [Candidatus Cloacimonadaceae bacterium]
MKQFKALLIKEWHTHKFVFLVPSLVLGVSFLLLSLISIYARIRYGILPEINAGAAGEISLIVVLRNLHYLVSVIAGGFCVFVSVQLTEHLLNQDYIKKCEIMHHSQPVSLIKILAAKYVFSVPLMLVQFLVLAIASSLILSTVAAFIGYNTWGLGLAAVLSPSLLIFISMMTFSSVMWLFSCTFRKQAALKLILSLLIIDLLRLWLSHWGAVDLFSPMAYYQAALILPFSILSIQGAEFSFILESVFSQQNLIRLGVSVLMYIAGYFLYKRRELS